MTMSDMARLRALMQPEESARRAPGRSNGWQPPGVSLKAVFWWAVSVVLALAIGNLT